MSFRKKLLMLFAATVLLCVAVISASVYSTIRRSFERADRDRAKAIAAQFRSEFQRRGSEVEGKIESVARSETVQRMALDLDRGVTDTGGYVGEQARWPASNNSIFWNLSTITARSFLLRSGQLGLDIPRPPFRNPPRLAMRFPPGLF